ncbi:MAG: deoxynucleoside kinase [Ignavibacteriaceae bacterium]|nr:deoxynucleoside kinase [Ignavibacteriaceae bacterium]
MIKLEKEIKYIAIEGVIGAGKTSLAEMLAEKLNANLILEQFENNPFLGNFYTDRKRYAFQTQMFFLVNRFKQQQDLGQENLFVEFIVADYILEKDRIFAYMNLTGEELKLYESVFPLLQKNLRQPDLVVYLQSTVERLMQNIRSRNRSFEKNISKNYIAELNEAYNHFFFRYNSTPLLIVNAAEIDFVKNPNHYLELEKAIFRKERGMIEYFQPEIK